MSNSSNINNEQNQWNPLEKIIYISLPEDMSRDLGDFTIDPGIMLPAELPPNQDNYNPGELSWEMIISGMLKVIAYEPDNEHRDYYRNFVLAVKPNIVDELSEAAVFKAKNKDFDIAEDILHVLNGLLPDNSRILLNLALVYEERAEGYLNSDQRENADKYSHKAYEIYKRIFSLREVVPEAHFNAGFFFLRNYNIEKSKEHLLKFLESDPPEEKRDEAQKVLSDIENQNLLDSLFKEAFDSIQMGKEEKGIEKIKQFIEENNNVWNAWFLLGWGNRRIGNYQEAYSAFLKANELNTDHTDTLNELAICTMELGKFEESKSYLTKALRKEPENVKILSNLGIVSMKEEDFESAEGFFKSALDVDPDDPVAKKYLSHIHEQK